MPLKASTTLSNAAPQGKQVQGPTHVEADQLHGETDQYFEAKGKVIMRNLREQVEADWMHYDEPNDEVQARGHVVLIQDGDRIDGTELKLKLTARLGDMKDVIYALHGDRGGQLRGKANTVQFLGPDIYQMDEATYSTCPAQAQDWVMKMDRLNLDYTTSLGSARQVRVEFMDVPILYSPWLDFSLDNRRKSGFLAPSYGATTGRGAELITPWYWNIAPNRDATFTPHLMSKRGTLLGTEFRYLEPSYSGIANLEILPADKVANKTRYYGLLDHRHQIDARWSGSLHYEKVSDHAYFTDLSSMIGQTSQSNLLQEATLAYNAGWWQAGGRLQRYQTLQDPATPVVSPYQRMPQLTLNASKANLSEIGLQMDFSSEFVAFDQSTGNRVQGNRTSAHPTLRLPIDTPFSTFTPQVGLYLSRYDLNPGTTNMPDGLSALPTGGFDNTSLVLPTFSVNTGLFFERDTTLGTSKFTQTLEPRLFFVYIPYKDQTRTPVFDSGVSDISLDQLFQENQFIGIDRINDAKQMTLAVTSRFLDQDSGQERLQVTVGQRYYFADQRVTMSGVAARSSNSSDVLALMSSQVNNRLRLSSGVQFNTNSSKIARANLAATFQQGPGRLINADYRYTQASLNQFDLSTQWPIAPKWHGLARVNYSVRDAKLVEGLVGFEYDVGCWALRGVMQRLATTSTTTSNAFFLQLELNGLTKLGPNPLEVLKRSITGYVPSSQLAQPDPYNPRQ